MTQLIKYEAAKLALEQAVNFDEVMGIKDIAERLELYARQAQDDALIERATKIKIRAERRAGQMLREAAEKGMRATPAGNVNPSNKKVSPQSTPSPATLGEIGISRNESSRWQKVASIPEMKFEEQLEAGSSVTEMLRQVKKEERPNIPSPEGKYRIIYADPPWWYGNNGVIGDDNYGHVGRHYPSMKISELCQLPIKEMAEDNAVLFLWVTSPLLAECFEVIEAWGFKYKSSFVWDKIKHNFAHYNSMRHEFLLVCTRGSCTPDIDEKIDSVQSIERSKKHSEKPQEFRDIIEKLYTHGKRIELFAREKHENWETWGNEPDTGRIAE